VESPPKTQGLNQEEIIWETKKEYVPVVVDNHGNDIELWFIERVKREIVNREVNAILRHNWLDALWVRGGSTGSMVVREGSLVIMVYYFSEAQSELHCGVVVNGERGKVREVELENVKVVECPDVKELSDTIAELKNKGYWYDYVFYPFMAWVIALLRKLYNIEI